ncbi:MAG: 4Fe-4S dicluster domain-containing protein [Candidatus Lokiarchaeota archaeon]|nr:4Fe-4S dicluster domain-containing protein [Candidatus Lokiarchaeota archaeon]
MSSYKVLIVYFSQTGNTFKIAKNIREGIKKSGNYCILKDIKKTDLDELTSYDLIGFGTPTFFYREPKNFTTFLKSLKPRKFSTYCFLFCTHGSQMGNTFYYMNEELKKNGYIVIDCFDCYASTSLQFYPDPMHTANHPDEVEFREAREFGQNLCNSLTKIRKGKDWKLPEFKLIKNTWWAHESENLTLKVLRKISPKFSLNDEKCVKCMVCQENCPTDAINMNAEPPELQKEGCIFCWNCEKICPNGAIEADWSIMKKKSKKNLLRYIDILKDAEKRGNFRPHINYKIIY